MPSVILLHGEIDVIFSADMLNGDADEPALDVVTFLRSTVSPAAFLQQLSRGKEYLTVLDFIGSYKNAGRVPAFLADCAPDAAAGGTFATGSRQGTEYPDGCEVHFDPRTAALFERLRRWGKCPVLDPGWLSR